MPKGYDTNVGELGDLLSDGEKQRIGLARAFLCNSPMIMLDEPTSNLDSLNEGNILKSINEAKHGKSIVLVSHRKSTAKSLTKLTPFTEADYHEKRQNHTRKRNVTRNGKNLLSRCA